MRNKTDLESLLRKYKGVSPRDFLIARIAAKLDVIELTLVEKLYPNADARQAAFDQLDSGDLSMTELYLEFLQRNKEGGNGDAPTLQSN
ncbi:MAG: hypothetical protein ACLPRE_11590 [Limisphaerales bacterium]